MSCEKRMKSNFDVTFVRVISLTCHDLPKTARFHVKKTGYKKLPKAHKRIKFSIDHEESRSKVSHSGERQK